MKTLIHLVSEQTMQNLLPILALRPERVVQVRSRPDKFRTAAENLSAAVRYASSIPCYQDLSPQFVEEVIDEDSPSVESTRHAVARHLDAHPAAFVNVTGGTKLMSLGAYLAVDTYPHCARLYCDTSTQQLISLGPTPLPDLPPFEKLASTLTLSVVMAAHGVHRNQWDSEPATPELLQVGRAGFEAYRKAFHQFKEFRAAVRNHFRGDRGRIPDSRTKLNELCEQPIPSPTADAVKEFLEAAVAAGFLERDATGRYRPGVEPSRNAVERLANILDGSWLELYVLSLLVQNPSRWSDPHWSVRLRNPREIPIGETDVVCVEVPRCALHLISCKTQVRQPLETLEALTQRRRDMGGMFAQATLAVLELSEDDRKQQLTNWSRYLQIRLLVGEEISDRFSS